MYYEEIYKTPSTGATGNVDGEFIIEERIDVKLELDGSMNFSGTSEIEIPIRNLVDSIPIVGKKMRNHLLISHQRSMDEALQLE